MSSERGQAAVLYGLILVLVIGAIFLAFSGTLPGMKAGADTIGKAIGNTIDTAYEQEMRNLEQQILNGTVVSAWVNNQRIPANPRAIEHHTSGGAVEAIKCYNDHGAFMVMANHQTGDWYIHCLEEDGRTVRTTFWQRDGNKFHLKTAYTKGDGAWTWTKIRAFFEDVWGARKAAFPSDGVLYVDGVPAPYIP